jgi:hypothetical protein
MAIHRATGRFRRVAVARWLITSSLCGVAVSSLSPEAAGQGRTGSQGLGIAVDFAAVDGRGQPVTDLRADEVTVRLGRETVSVSDLRFLPAASGRDAASRLSGQPFGRAEAVDFERAFLLVVDDESLPQGSEQSTRDALRGFVRQLDERDRVALAIVPHGGLLVSMTNDHGRVLPMLQRISGRAARRESGTDAACRGRDVLRQLEGLLSSARAPTGPLVMVFFSGSLYDGGGAVQAPLGTTIACDLQLSDFRQVGLRAAESRTYVYIVQPETFTAVAWTSHPRAGLEHLAGATGGRILQLSGRDPTVLDRVGREMSGLYLARARVNGNVRTGITHAIRIETTRPGVTIVARPHLAVPAERVSR